MRIQISSYPFCLNVITFLALPLSCESCYLTKHQLHTKYNSVDRSTLELGSCTQIKLKTYSRVNPNGNHSLDGRKPLTENWIQDNVLKVLKMKRILGVGNGWCHPWRQKTHYQGKQREDRFNYSKLFIYDLGD